MNAQAAMSTPEDDVNNLLQQVADEHGLEVNLGLPNAATASAVAAPVATQQQPVAAGDLDNDLSARLAQLRGK
jgi:charged multivesicular body protein 1